MFPPLKSSTSRSLRTTGTASLSLRRPSRRTRYERVFARCAFLVVHGRVDHYPRCLPNCSLVVNVQSVVGRAKRAYDETAAPGLVPVGTGRFASASMSSNWAPLTGCPGAVAGVEDPMNAFWGSGCSPGMARLIGEAPGKLSTSRIPRRRRPRAPEAHIRILRRRYSVGSEGTYS